MIPGRGVAGAHRGDATAADEEGTAHGVGGGAETERNVVAAGDAPSDDAMPVAVAERRRRRVVANPGREGDGMAAEVEARCLRHRNVIVDAIKGERAADHAARGLPHRSVHERAVVTVAGGVEGGRAARLVQLPPGDQAERAHAGDGDVGHVRGSDDTDAVRDHAAEAAGRGADGDGITHPRSQPRGEHEGAVALHRQRRAAVQGQGDGAAAESAHRAGDDVDRGNGIAGRGVS